MNNGFEKGSKTEKSGKAFYRKASKVHLKCHLCEFEYVEKTKLNLHMKRCHSDDNVTKGQLISEVKGTFPCLQIHTSKSQRKILQISAQVCKSGRIKKSLITIIKVRDKGRNL